MMLTLSADNRNVIDAASASAVVTLGIWLWNGLRRSEPAWDTCGGNGMPVATPPGATALTRMPCGPYVKAADFVRPMTAYLDVV